MGKWNYRVVLRHEQFAIHEVFYDDDGGIAGMTEEPVFPRAQTLEELRSELLRYTSALDEPVLTS